MPFIILIVVMVMEFVFLVFVNVTNFGVESLVKSQHVLMIVVDMVIVSLSQQLLRIHLEQQNVLALMAGMMPIVQNLSVKILVMEMVFASMELVHALKVMKVSLVPIRLTIYMENVAINVLIIVQCNANQLLILISLELEKVVMLVAQRNVSLDVLKETTKSLRQLVHVTHHIVKN